MKKTSVGGIVLQYVLLAAVGSFNFGFSLSALNTSKAFVSLDFKWCPSPDGKTANRDCPADQSYSAFVNVGVFLGAAFGCLIGIPITEMGRREAMIVMNGVMTLGAVLSASSEGFASLLIARIIVGLGVGLSTVCVPMLISEVAAKQDRGKFGTLHQLLITIGIFTAMLLGLAFKEPAEKTQFVELTTFQQVWWRVMLSIPMLLCVPAMVLFLTKYKYDTPHSLIVKNQTEKSEEFLRKLRDSDDVRAEFGEIEKSVNDAEVLKKQSLSVFSSIVDPYYRRVILVGVSISILQQLSGINVLMANSNKLYEASGLSSQSTYISVGMSALNIVMSIPPIYILDKVGRRVLFLVGATGQFFALSFAFIATMIDYQNKTCQYIAVASTFLYVIFFAIGLGPVLWVYLHEIFPLEIKQSAAATASSLNWIFGLITVLPSEFLLTDDPRAVFGIFAAMCGLAVVFIFFFVKETKGRSIDDSPYLNKKSRKSLGVHHPSIEIPEAYNKQATHMSCVPLDDETTQRNV